MKLAFASNQPYTSNHLSQSKCDSRYLMIYDAEENSWESIPNPFQGFLPRQIALPMARILKRRGVDALVANQCNELLCRELMKAEIPIAMGVTETIEKAAQNAMKGVYLFGLTQYDPKTGEARLRFLFRLPRNLRDQKKKVIS